MPIGTPSVPYRLPGSQYERWVDIYTRLGVERILFLGSEVTDASGQQPWWPRCSTWIRRTAPSRSTCTSTRPGAR